LRHATPRAQNPKVAARRLSLLAVALALALTPAVAGCGEDEQSASEQWAGDVCSELSTWVTSVGEAVKSLTGNPLSLDQKAVQTATEDLKVATDDLVDGLGDLEPVETEAGDQARTELTDLGTQLQQQLDEIEQDSKNGSLSLVTLSTQLATASAAVRSTYESLQSLDTNGELREGFEDAESCDSLRQQVDTIGD
jgi:uncharacterized phage infection (PIP) family protein YhgE